MPLQQTVFDDKIPVAARWSVSLHSHRSWLIVNGVKDVPLIQLALERTPVDDRGYCRRVIGTKLYILPWKCPRLSLWNGIVHAAIGHLANPSTSAFLKPVSTGCFHLL